MTRRIRLNDRDDVRDQYRDSTNLDARAQLHHRFSTNPYGWFRWVFDHLDLGPQARVLEVGAGPAGMWSSQRDRVPDGWRVVLSDLSPGMAARARTTVRDEGSTFLVSDAQAIPFRDGTFEAVIANHMLYHVPDLAAAVEELARVLVERGRLFAATNGARHMAQLRSLLDEDAVRVEGFDLDTGGDALATHFSDITVDRYADALEVTDADALVAYARSMMTFGWGTRSEDEIRAQVVETIERDGVFRIDKDAGLFTATRK